MAKSNTNMKGAKLPKLELDYLRLVYVGGMAVAKGFDFTGYLLVVTNEVRDSVNHWKDRYKDHTRDMVVIEVVSLQEIKKGDNEYRMILDELEKEKLKNKIAMYEQGNSGAVASQGKIILENVLAEYILKKEGQINKSTKYNGIQWDFEYISE